MDFQTIFGHQTQLEHLARLANSNSVPHALLFSGPEGVGKRRVALRFAAELVAAEQSEQKLIAAGNHPDMHFVKKESDKKDLPVDTIRELIEKLSLKPYYGSSSVAIIDNAHEMNIAASNALLKTLEEPSGHSYIILVSHASHRLPETILSRCQTIHFSELAPEETKQVLSALSEELSLEEQVRDRLFRLSPTSLRALALDRFVDRKTLRFLERDEPREHLMQLARKAQELRRKLEEGLGAPASLASLLAKEKDDRALVWQEIRSFAREKLHNSEKNRNAWADILLETLSSEQLVRERNLNPELHMTSVLLRMSDEQYSK